MKSVKAVEFGFENCEVSGCIPVEDFGDFSMRGLHTDISRVACNAIEKIDRVDSIHIKLYSSADRIHWGIDFEDDGPTLFERIEKFGDITSITIVYDDDSEEIYYAPYDEGEREGELGAPNVNQHVSRGVDGSLFVDIKRPTDFFDNNPHF